MITGCTSGMGLVLAQTCAGLGAQVVMLNRPSPRADAALQGVLDAGGDAVLVPCDLSSFASVRAAGVILRRDFSDQGCDVLCNNAGIMGVADKATEDGFDVQMQANHLSHFQLTHEVWPLLETAGAQRGEARVVNHSSGARGKPGRPLHAKYLARNGGNLGATVGRGWRNGRATSSQSWRTSCSLTHWTTAQGSAPTTRSRRCARIRDRRIQGCKVRRHRRAGTAGWTGLSWGRR